MRTKWSCFVCLSTMIVCNRSYAQPDSMIAHDRDIAKTLPEVTVKAYERNQLLRLTPAAVSIVGKEDLNTYNSTSILQAVNAVPGVRMEERSPGSYRFGIRGSALESPFGVRNVKVYYNGIPYTDPSGNTYLNQLGFYNISSMEVIKGPGSSLYGSGTGGVLLLSSMPEYWHPGATINYTGGSYALSNTGAEVRTGDTGFKNVIRYQHLASNGYRAQSEMHNDIISWDAVAKHGKKNELSIHFFYGKLYYQTPGGLTLQEYNASPAEARPGTAAAPGAVQAQAAIYQQSFLSGFTYKQTLSDHWTNSTTLYGSYFRQLNPNTRNYSRTSEPNAGGRTFFTYETASDKNSLQWTTGGEIQTELAQNRTYVNASGSTGKLLSDQEINNDQGTVFTQLSFQTTGWVFTSGASVSRLHVALTTPPGAAAAQDKVFNNEVAPRIAILNRLSETMSLYAVAEKGFSPPTIDELAPTGSIVNLSLAPERGWNYEAGLRGYALNSRLYYDLNVFYFGLQNTIVQRRDSSGGDYYLNSGSTRQAGAELFLRYPLSELTHFVNSFVRLGYTAYYFRYNNFLQGNNDYSGKALPGTPPNALTAGATLALRRGIYWNLDYYFCDKVALNDANTAYAAPYHLLGSRLGYKRTGNKYAFDVFAGVNNILNQKYSLGNDINSAIGRYYNAAAPINYYAGLSIGYLK